MSHYFENDKNIKSEEKIINVKIKEKPFSFYVDNGIFSKKGLDFGTRTLLENLDLENIHGKILDFGCGYGPIGIYISKEKNLPVDMIDINKRSLKLAQKNSALNQVQTNVFESNIYENINQTYDFIITNPPIRVGKEILYKILIEAKEHLKPNGELWFVIHKDQGAKTTFKMLENYYNLTLVTKNKGFYIIQARNN